MLKEAGVRKVRIMTNNPLKIQGLKDNGIEVVNRISHISGISIENLDYLKTTRERMGHILELE